MKEQKKNILAPKAVMFNDRKPGKDSLACGVFGIFGKEILHYWEEPAEESESEDSSQPSIRIRSVMTH